MNTHQGLPEIAGRTDQAISGERPGERGQSGAEQFGGSGREWLNALEDAELVDGAAIAEGLRECNFDVEATAEWLVSHGKVSRRDLMMALADLTGLPYVELNEFRINLGNRSLVSEESARRNAIFPIFCINRVITLAVCRPVELDVLDQIRLKNGCEVDQCLVSPTDLQHLIEWAFGGFSGGSGQATATAGDLAWSEILKDVTDSPAVKLVSVLLNQAAVNRASDIHIDTDEKSMFVRFRVDGVLREVPAPPRSLLPAVVSRIKVLARMDIVETRKPQDGHFRFAQGRDAFDVRVATLPSTNGEAVVLRLLNAGKSLLTLEELGMDSCTRDKFDRLIRSPHGMVLTTGPTGSGKTTTLYSALTRIDRVRQSVITLEDPVEIRISQVRQVAVNPKAGLTFQTGLRSILRQDPDCIMVGEIRDDETAEIALQAALTGHLVFSTLHTNSAAAAVARLKDMRSPGFLVASALIGVLAQRLCRRVCTNCARPVDIDSASCLDSLQRLGISRAALGNDGKVVSAVGCKRCGQSGYDGRVGIFELLVVDDEIRKAIVSDSDTAHLTRLARKNGMRSLVEDGLDKLRRGLTTADEILRVAGQGQSSAIGGENLVDGASNGRPNAADGAAGMADSDPDKPISRARSTEPFDVVTYEEIVGRWLAKAPGGRAGTSVKRSPLGTGAGGST